MTKNNIKVSVVMPCLNEQETIGECVRKALQAFREHNIAGEVVVSDNGSTDDSVKIALSLGARVAHQPEKGYGNAYHKGITEAKGKYIVIGDSDDTYDFSEIHKFIAPLENGYELVMGSRLRGKILPGAMPWLHRWIGNPFLSWFLNRLFHTGISDSHCGMRAFTKDAYSKMHLKTTGMEFASEMVINASKAGLKITEIPITYYPRKGESKLHSFRDGWRHMRFMLMYSPTHLFLIPGFLIMFIGMALMIALIHGPVFIFGHGFDIHFLVLGGVLTLLGFQIVNLGVYAKAISHAKNILIQDRFVEYIFKRFTLEKGITIGLIIFVIGFIINLFILITWIRGNFGALHRVREALFGLILIVIGIQTIFSSFILSMLQLKTEK
jgi:glycosyltransferase involved in cell wall biosynthesis